ncbi:MAG: CPBP family intramembrane metalloprotease [Theionarchaea archaeon]|nr:CPBP family intramembrane metalloprotease [Theionarchaea archaeon]
MEEKIVVSQKLITSQKKIHGLISIAIIAFLSGSSYIFLKPIVEESGRSVLSMTIANGVVIAAIGLIGFFFAARVGFPWWWHSAERSAQGFEDTVYVLFSGIVLVILNTAINTSGSEQVQQMFSTGIFTPRIAIGFSLQAAVNEEIIFRLCTFSGITWLARHFIHSHQKSLICGAITSVFFFALFHHGSGRVLAFSLGLILVYIYYKRGLIPAMIVHFFANAIPFLLISSS